MSLSEPQGVGTCYIGLRVWSSGLIGFKAPAFRFRVYLQRINVKGNTRKGGL